MVSAKGLVGMPRQPNSFQVYSPRRGHYSQRKPAGLANTPWWPGQDANRLPELVIARLYLWLGSDGEHEVSRKERVVNCRKRSAAFVVVSILGSESEYEVSRKEFVCPIACVNASHRIVHQ